MSHNSGNGFGTKVIHGGDTKDRGYHSLGMPIYQTSTFYFDTCEEGGRCFAGESDGYIYTRLGNPTTVLAEEKVAELEGAEAAAAAGSGMGAISATLWTLAGAGKHIVADGTLYGCTFALLSHGMTRYGVEVTFVDSSDPEEVRKALKENTVAVYLETPANPNLKIADIQAIAELTHAYNQDIKVVVDNTFATPYLHPGGRRGGPQRHQVHQRPRRRGSGLCGRLQGVHHPGEDVRPQGHDRRRAGSPGGIPHPAGPQDL